MNIKRETTEFVLKCGWKISIVNYWTQGEHDRIQNLPLNDIKIEGEGDPNADPDKEKEDNKFNYDFTYSILQEMTDLSKELAVKKIELPDGKVFIGETLTLDIIKSIPYNSEIADELKSIIEKHLDKKKEKLPEMKK